MIDGNTFVNRFALSTQGTSYDIVVSFDFKDGILQIRCPSCAAAIPLKNKDPTGRCQYCGAAYLVPAKVLRLM
jgi:DNA-directed RNA polymerase subunit RPC12/RpoP